MVLCEDMILVKGVVCSENKIGLRIDFWGMLKFNLDCFEKVLLICIDWYWLER